MTYTEFVNDNCESFSINEYFLVALDLAKMIDTEFFKDNPMLNPILFSNFYKICKRGNIKTSKIEIPSQIYKQRFPSYFSIENKKAPTKKTKLLIVDDNAYAILKTFIAIAGWENLRIDILFYPQDVKNNPKDSYREKIKNLSQEIIKRDPQIILMDEILRTIRGPGLIEFINKMDLEKYPIFVANTGGGPQSLYDSAPGKVLKNCAKGLNLEGVAKAVNLF